MEEYTFCHLGDLGHELSAEDIDTIGEVDVLFIPAGGNFTIDGKEAAKIAKDIHSKITIPMHYKTPKLSFPLDGVETFLTHMKKAEKIDTNMLILEGPVKDQQVVKVFAYPE